MAITLEQARALDAFDRYGTYAAAAAKLGKVHTAIVYSLKALEEQTGVRLLERGRYRSRLTPAGRRVLEQCRKLLASERELESLVAELKSGWEPALRIVFDGMFPLQPIVDMVGDLTRRRVPTRIEVFAAFLGGVERSFVRRDAHVMISVLPPETVQLESVELGAIEIVLVAHRTHALARQEVSLDQLASHTFLTVRGPTPRLNLSTAALEPHSTVHLNDFVSEKAAILSGVGFGWVPRYLVSDELKRGQLQLIRWERESTHMLDCRVYHRPGEELGRAGRAFVAGLRERREIGVAVG
jgi:DNA-binding transcriptional LysR family regulator